MRHALGITLFNIDTLFDFIIWIQRLLPLPNLPNEGEGFSQDDLPGTSCILVS